MSERNTKQQKTRGARSTESILITRESNWIHLFALVWSVRFVRSVSYGWLNQTDDSLPNSLSKRMTAAQDAAVY